MDKNHDNYYPDYNDINFDRVLNKYEFQKQSKRDFVYQDPRQLLLRNLISKNTIYDNMLLFWEPGTGKTGAAITIAEGFKEYVSNMGRKILVLVKNGNIEKNFRNEIMSDFTRHEYMSKEQEDTLHISKDKESKKEILNKITRKVNKMYNFMTYGTFVNQTLGMKQFEKDMLGRNTSKQQRNKDGSVSRKKPINPITNLNNTVIIIDEAHNVTNNDVYIALSKILQKSYNYRLVLLTATPMYDNPKEIMEMSNLLNMNNSDNILPIRNDLFKPYKSEEPLMYKKSSNYLNDGILKSGLTSISDIGLDLLEHTLKGKVSYLKANTSTFPKTIDKGSQLLNKTGSINVVYCDMSSYQTKIYQKALKLDSGHVDNYIDDLESLDSEENVEEYISTSASSSLYKNSSDACTMTYPDNLYGQAGFMMCFQEKRGTSEFVLDKKYEHVFQLNKDLPMYSKKLAMMLENINNSPGSVFIYSNYVNYGGTGLIKQILLANGYTQFKSKSNSETNQYKSFILYDDSASVETRESQRRIFNHPDNKDGKIIKIIIGSPVISEGITLKNVRQVHLIEPSWNMSRINQIIGRAIRHHSHDDLPLNERDVEIYKYCSVSEKKSNKKLYFIDKEKYVLAEEKDRSNKVVERLLKRVAFDCYINRKIGHSDNTQIDHSAKCDYTTCEYTCLINKSDEPLDKFTYNLYLHFFEEFDIELNTSFIKELFKKYFIWTITDIVDYIQKKYKMISNESIYNALKQIIDNKTIILDQYDREGFLIVKGDAIIFNPINIDINSSIYSKMLDFSVDSNKYNLHDYFKLKFNKDLEETIEETIQEIIEETEETKEMETVTILSKEDIDYNMNIIENNKIFGTYRGRPQNKVDMFGPIDNKFRIVDKRDMKDDTEDKRKRITGKEEDSYKKPALKSIIDYLKITSRQIQTYIGHPDIDINNLSAQQLRKIIRKDLDAKHLVLK